jgi:hypothetical protein
MGSACAPMALRGCGCSGARRTLVPSCWRRHHTRCVCRRRANRGRCDNFTVLCGDWRRARAGRCVRNAFFRALHVGCGCGGPARAPDFGDAAIVWCCGVRRRRQMHCAVPLSPLRGVPEACTALCVAFKCVSRAVLMGVVLRPCSTQTQACATVEYSKAPGKQATCICMQALGGGFTVNTYLSARSHISESDVARRCTRRRTLATRHAARHAATHPLHCHIHANAAHAGEVVSISGDRITNPLRSAAAPGRGAGPRQQLGVPSRGEGDVSTIGELTTLPQPAQRRSSRLQHQQLNSDDGGARPRGRQSSSIIPAQAGGS